MSDAPHHFGLAAEVGLFALPNVVLLPRSILPLHIFEERYKLMIADALRTDRQIAMALLRPGWERNYYTRPEIEPVVCVGTIVNHEQLPDGRYNLLLQGQVRARVISERRVLQESTGVSYRVARLEPLSETPIMEIDLSDARRKLVELFHQPAYASLPSGRQFQRLLAGHLPTQEIADLIAFTLFDCPNIKQSLLADTDVRHRVWRVVQQVEALAPQWQNVPEDEHWN